MELIIKDNDGARDALRAAVADAGISLTALAAVTKLSQGGLTRFVNQGERNRQGRVVQQKEIHLLTFIRALDGAGYEVVARPKVTVQGSRRERRLRIAKGRANGREAPSGN